MACRDATGVQSFPSVSATPPSVRPLITEARTFWELIELRAAATPDDVMLLDADGRWFTFQEIRDWAERVAAGLHARGVQRDSPVTWQLPTRIETVVASFALSRLGAV